MLISKCFTPIHFAWLLASWRRVLANAGEIPVIAIALLPYCSNANDATNVLSTPPE